MDREREPYKYGHLQAGSRQLLHRSVGTCREQKAQRQSGRQSVDCGVRQAQQRRYKATRRLVSFGLTGRVAFRGWESDRFCSI